MVHRVWVTWDINYGKDDRNMMNPASLEAGFLFHTCLKNPGQIIQNILTFNRVLCDPFLVLIA